MFRVFNSLVNEHDWSLVAAAAFVGLLASLAAVRLLHRARAAPPRARPSFIAAAGCVMACGIWATQFIAWLAYRPGVSTAFDVSLTIGSLAAAVVFAALGIAVMVYGTGKSAAPAAGIVIGAGIAATQYLGMQAFIVPGGVDWSWELVASAFVLGPLLAAGAIAIAMRGDEPDRIFGAAVLLCFAILVVHFTATGAVEIRLPPTPKIAPMTMAPSWLALTVAIIALIFVGSGFATLFTKRRVREQNARLYAALDNMSLGLCTFDSEGTLVVRNRPYLDMYGLSGEVVKPGITLRRLLQHRKDNNAFDGDIEQYCNDMMATLAEGRTTSRELASADGRTILLRNHPLPGGGWVATHEDITDQRSVERQRVALHQQEQHRAKVEAEIAAFRSRVEDVLKTVRESAAAMRATATTLFGSSERTSRRAEGAVQSSNEASANVQTAAAAANEMSTSIAEISQQLVRASEMVRGALNKAQLTNEGIAKLAQVAQKIGDVVKLIQDIAGQTNLLALNATIEAARAGEAGRGFAVVASEVKSLAVQTAKATEEITAQIAAVQGSTATAVDTIRSITNQMHDIDQYTAAAAAAIEQQNAATGEISRNVTGAAEGTRGVVTLLSEVADAATETRGSAQTVLATSQAVEKAADSLREEVARFLGKVAV